MKFRQGKAPAILYQDGKRVYEFINGRLETEDVRLIAILLERGAIDVEGAVDPQALVRRDYEILTKPEIVEKAKEELGIEINVNQSKDGILRKVEAHLEGLR